MTPEEKKDLEESRKPLNFRTLRPQQAMDAISRGECPVLARYLRQTLSQPDRSFLTALADLLDPDTTAEGYILTSSLRKKRGRGRPRRHVAEDAYVMAEVKEHKSEKTKNKVSDYKAGKQLGLSTDSVKKIRLRSTRLARTK